MNTQLIHMHACFDGGVYCHWTCCLLCVTHNEYRTWQLKMQV